MTCCLARINTSTSFAHKGFGPEANVVISFLTVRGVGHFPGIGQIGALEFVKCTIDMFEHDFFSHSKRLILKCLTGNCLYLRFRNV